MALLTNAASRSNSPVVSLTSLPEGENSSRLDKSRFQPANRAFERVVAVCLSVPRDEARRSTLLALANSSRKWNGFGK